MFPCEPGRSGHADVAAFDMGAAAAHRGGLGVRVRQPVGAGGATQRVRVRAAADARAAPGRERRRAHAGRCPLVAVARPPPVVATAIVP